MKYNMLTKQITLYIIIAVVGFIAVTTICFRHDYNKVYDYYSEVLYQQANEIAGTFAKDTLTPEYLSDIEADLKIVSELNHTRIMFVSPFGDVMLDTGFSGTADSNGYLYELKDFDYGRLKGAHTQTGDFYGVFDETVVSAYFPIASNFTMKGYVVINMPETVITDRVYDTFNTNYLTLVIAMLLSLSMLVLYFIHIHKPINELTKATEEYGKGNLSYRIKIHHNDEIGRLAASLDYMAKELNEMDRFQQKFLSNISHDFRSPLTSIKGYLEAIEDGTVPPEMINKYINIVLFETERLTKLTSNILTLNELDPKTVRLEITTFDINSVIKHTIETLEGSCKKKGIKFSLTFSGTALNVKADKGKIQQVIYNLVDNAIKFSHDNSFIYVTVKEKGDKAQISIKDTGSGIAKKDIDKIQEKDFDIFGNISQDKTKIKTLKNNQHREAEKDKYKVLNVNLNTEMDVFIEKLKELRQILIDESEKIEVPYDISLYKASNEKIDPDGFDKFSVNPFETLDNLEKTSTSKETYLYKINVPENTKLVFYSNITFFENNNQTLPLGMDISQEGLINMDKYKLELKGKDEFNINIFKNEFDNFVKNVKVYEYNLTSK